MRKKYVIWEKQGRGIHFTTFTQDSLHFDIESAQQSSLATSNIAHKSQSTVMRSLKKDQFIFHVCLLVLDIQINEIVLTLKIVTCTYIKPCREIYYCIPYLLVTSPVTNIRHLIFIFDSSALTLPMSNGHQNLSLLFITYYLTCHSFCSPNAPPIVHFLILS